MDSTLIWALPTPWSKNPGAQEVAHSMKPEQDLSSAPVGLQRNTTSVWKFKGRQKSGRRTDRSATSGQDTWLHWFQGGQTGHWFLSVLWTENSLAVARHGICFWDASAALVSSKQHHVHTLQDNSAARTTTWIVGVIRRFPSKAHSWSHLRH